MFERECCMSKYEVGKQLLKIGVVDGKDLSTEAGLVKLMLCANLSDKAAAKQLLSSSIAGEMSV